jgi:triacylglycerol esterase/lipase EstA (alpha/beta hydrolase family)
MNTAVTLLLTLTGGFALYVAAAWYAHQHGVGMVALVLGAPALYLGVFASITAVWFALAWIYRSPRPPQARLDVAQTVRLFVDEWITLLGSGFRMGFAWWLMRDPAPRPAKAPVLLVHGVLCNAGVWLGMRASLRARGLGPIYTIDLVPPLASIDDFSDQLAARIEAILAQTGARTVSLVGHSMGGLVARAYLRRHGAARVARVVTVGTPHDGSVLAWLFPGEPLREMRPGNDWLRALNSTALPPVPIVSIWSWHDSMVAPQASSNLSGARNVVIHGVGHNALLRDRRVAALVAEALGDERALPVNPLRELRERDLLG